MPLISIIIPTYNHRKFLPIAIESALEQHGVEREIIIVDDGSTDGTEESIKELFGNNIRYFRQENKGESAARNLGAEYAKGGILAFLDADDMWLPDKLCVQYAFLQKYSQYSAVYCRALGIDVNNKIIPRLPYGFYLPKNLLSLETVLYKGFPLGGSTLVIYKEAFFNIGGFDPLISHGEDLDFCLSMLTNKLRVGIIPKPLTMIRFHSQSQSIQLTNSKYEDSFKDHLYLFNKLSKSDLGQNHKKVSEKIDKEYLKLLLFYVISQQSEKITEMRECISNTNSSILNRELWYYDQIEYFTPFIYLLHRKQEDVLSLINRIFQERDRHISPNPNKDNLCTIKATVWCANNGKSEDYTYAWKQISHSIKITPKLCWERKFWAETFRLLFGRKFIKIYLFAKTLRYKQWLSEKCQK